MARYTVKGRVALITGAAGGIGLKTARALLRAARGLPLQDRYLLGDRELRGLLADADRSRPVPAEASEEPTAPVGDRR